MVDSLPLAHIQCWQAYSMLYAMSGDRSAVDSVQDCHVCQSEALSFVWCCRFGAVLADEMGLGKTLQVIALLWTLLKQGPQVMFHLQWSSCTHES